MHLLSSANYHLYIHLKNFICIKLNAFVLFKKELVVWDVDAPVTPCPLRRPHPGTNLAAHALFCMELLSSIQFYLIKFKLFVGHTLNSIE